MVDVAYSLTVWRVQSVCDIWGSKQSQRPLDHLVQVLTAEVFCCLLKLSASKPNLKNKHFSHGSSAGLASGGLCKQSCKAWWVDHSQDMCQCMYHAGSGDIDILECLCCLAHHQTWLMPPALQLECPQVCLPPLTLMQIVLHWPGNWWFFVTPLQKQQRCCILVSCAYMGMDFTASSHLPPTPNICVCVPPVQHLWWHSTSWEIHLHTAASAGQLHTAMVSKAMHDKTLLCSFTLISTTNYLLSCKHPDYFSKTRVEHAIKVTATYRAAGFKM